MAWWDVFRAGAIGVAPAAGSTGQPRSPENEPGGSLQDWQRQAWGYYQELGEIHYAGSFYSRMLSGVDLLVQELGVPPGSTESAEEWLPSANTDLLAVRGRLENSRGGLSQLQGDYGRLRFVQGEAQLACTLLPAGEAPGDPFVDANGEAYVESWEMLSAEELSYNKQAGEYTRRRARSGASGADERIPETDADEPLVNTMTAWRFYHRDPQFSGMADSSMRAVLADCEELLLLKQSIRNTARNRGAGNGVFVLPKAMGGDEIDAGDGTMIPRAAKQIYDALTAPIVNEKAASAVTPVILFAPPGTTASEVFHVDIRGAALYRETGLRDECIRRIATGLDMPPEELLGISNANHWTAWQIDEAKWTSHGAPVASEFVGQLTAALLAPLAVDLGLDPQRVRFWYDATSVVQDPDRAQAAKEAHNNLTISDAAYREARGWDEEDAPDLAEYERRAKLKTNEPAPAPATSEPEEASVRTAQVIGLAEACVLRCRELAGSKLRTRVQGAVSKGAIGPNLMVRMRGRPNHEVAHCLGDEFAATCDADALVAGAGQVFLTGMIRMGLAPPLAETLVRRVEEHAARTLFDDDADALPDEVLAICGLVSQRA